MRCFLHNPARTFEAIESFVKTGASESEQLDFKSIPWVTGKSLEAAKDVVALANLLGGDMIIGVGNKQDCAHGLNLIPQSEVPTITNNIRIEGFGQGGYIEVRISSPVILKRAANGKEVSLMKKRHAEYKILLMQL